jgi:HK97 family phage prohead protease
MATGTLEMEKKHIGGKIAEVKQVDRDGIPVGIVEGYIATFDIDRIDDKFVPGAFVESINQLKSIGKKNLPLKDTHGRTIGGFPLDTVKEDSIGLFGIGEINLDVEQGREAYSLAKQGVYDSFSIGFFSVEIEWKDDVRNITKAEVLEGSILDTPCNLSARVTDVKGATTFKNLPLADRDREWDASAAKARVREWAGADEGLDTSEVQNKYKQCFFWYDEGNPEVFASYKLPFTDVIDGRLVAVPRGIFAAAAAMQGARGGVDIPEGDRPDVIKHIDSYYEKMGLESPFSESRTFRIDEFKDMDERTLENMLSNGVRFTRETSKALIRILKESGLLREEVDTGHREGDLSEGTKKALDAKLDEVLKTIGG